MCYWRSVLQLILLHGGGAGQVCFVCVGRLLEWVVLVTVGVSMGSGQQQSGGLGNLRAGQCGPGQVTRTRARENRSLILHMCKVLWLLHLYMCVAQTRQPRRVPMWAGAQRFSSLTAESG